MTQPTKVNEYLLPEENPTVLNPLLPPEKPAPAGAVTLVNPYITDVTRLEPGSILCGAYRIERKLSVAAGEADIYLCSREGNLLVAKVYRRAVAIKPEVAAALEGLQCPYIARALEFASHGEATVEILPYYPLGSLQGKTFSFDALREKVIPCLNEGLHRLHLASIIHKDLKPSNIMVTDREGSVAIIDFGISSVADSGSTVLLTKTGMTPEYAAPETFKGLFLTCSDYYSLGITLYELFCGQTPYHGMSSEEIEQYIAIQRLPFPEEMPPQLQNLIRGLTYYDISNRHEPDNPNRRWGYEEVCRWLAGEELVVPGEGRDLKKAPPYSFCEAEYEDRRELVRALVRSWREGKKHLFRGLLSDYFRAWDPKAYEICREAEQEATRVSGRDDLIFWQTMLRLDPESGDLFWQGRIYQGLPALGRELLEDLRTESGAMNDFMASVYKEKILSRYAAFFAPEDPQFREALEALENAYRAAGSGRERKLCLYQTGYMLSGQRILWIGGEEFHTLDELTGYMKEILGENCQHLEEFRKFCHILMDRYDHLHPGLESWLLALGKQEAVDNWRAAMAAPVRGHNTNNRR